MRCGPGLAVAAVLLCGVGPARGDVRLLRRADGTALIFNDIGSGWKVNGRAPSDDYLLSRRDAATPYDDLIRSHAAREGVDHRLVKSVMLVESNFNPRAVSRKGARGLMQLMPGTAAQLGVRNSFDAAENIRGGVRYLAELLSTFGGDVALALAAYNAGPYAVLRHGGVPPYPETQEYLRRAMLAYTGSSVSHAVGGSFRAAAAGERPPARTAPSSLAALARPAAPVRVRRNEDGIVITNQPGAARAPVAPVLGRVVSADPAPGAR